MDANFMIMKLGTKRWFMAAPRELLKMFEKYDIG